MAVMSSAPVDDRPPWSSIPRGRAFVHDDLAVMPDDGRRYEIIDGVLIVTPAPSVSHQRAAANVFRILDRAAPHPEWEVFFAPLDVRLSDSTLEPDILVAQSARFTAKNLPEAPALAVEILSPSTRRLDLTLKTGPIRSRQSLGILGS
jgi:Uma2 family endonuclease